MPDNVERVARHVCTRVLAWWCACTVVQAAVLEEALGGRDPGQVTGKLDLSDQGLTVLPAAIGGLTALTRLYLHSNQLTSLPAAIGDLTALITLVLRHNQLTSLPEAIGGLTTLTTLVLTPGNAGLQRPPLEVATQGVAAIRGYFEQQQQQARYYPIFCSATTFM